MLRRLDRHEVHALQMVGPRVKAPEKGRQFHNLLPHRLGIGPDISVNGSDKGAIFLGLPPARGAMTVSAFTN
jgi:hypothetical protein